MKKKNKNTGPSTTERNARIKKQLISTGVYIALAAAVVGITSNSVKNILGSNDGYDVPEFDETDSNISLPSLDSEDEPYYPLPLQKEFELPDSHVSESPEGISADIFDPATVPVPEAVSESVPTPSVDASGEPETVDDTVPTVPNPVPSALPPTNEFDGNEEPNVRVKPSAGYISREFSRDELIYTPTMNDFRTHDGIDITGDIGSPVAAFARGEVADIYNDPLMGTTVVLRHSGGLVSSYSNLSAELPQEIVIGAVVDVGATIGGIGETAIIESAEVSHVHFELYKDEICVNPEDYIS